MSIRELYAQEAPSAQKAARAPYLIAIVLFCLFCLTSLLLTAERLRWNEWHVTTHPHGVETSLLPHG
jgi:hypothetical protein